MVFYGIDKTLLSLCQRKRVPVGCCYELFTDINVANIINNHLLNKLIYKHLLRLSDHNDFLQPVPGSEDSRYH